MVALRYLFDLCCYRMLKGWERNSFTKGPKILLLIIMLLMVFMLRVQCQDGFCFFRLEGIGRNCSERGMKNMTYISIHFRRTDMINHLTFFHNLTYVNDTYFLNAIHFFKKKYDVSNEFIPQCSPISNLIKLHLSK